jgi:hypothetical protein
MSIAEWLVSSLCLNVPARFRLELEKSGEFRGRAPWFDLVREDVVHWKDADGKSIRVDVWTPEPQRPGQPMQAINQREVEINGHWAMLVETSIFEGLPRHSFVIYMTLAEPPALTRNTTGEPPDGAGEPPAGLQRQRKKNSAKLRIVGEGMDRDEFESMFARLTYLPA